MPGFTETLVIIAIFLAIIVLPKRFGKKSEPVRRPHKHGYGLTGWQCIAILASIFWLAFFAIYLKPWNSDWYIFLYAGAGPVVLYWIIYCIFISIKKKRS